MNSMGTKPVYFHSGRAVWEISAGFVYHFRCSNGEHHFTKVRPYDQSEFDALNAQINQLRSELERNDNVLQDANQKVTDLETALEEYKNREPKIVKDTIDNSKKH